MIVLGVTGSIGMGKSTVCTLLMHLGIPVHDSDQEVHQLLSSDLDTLKTLAHTFPYFQFPQIYHSKNKAGLRIPDRQALGKLVFSDPEKKEALETILHPRVQKAQNHFLQLHERAQTKIVALDIPLLFETGAEARVDYTLAVTAPKHIQKSRVLSREGMTEEKFNAILKNQIPDGEKQVRADYIIQTGIGRAHTMKMLKTALRDIQIKY